MPSQAPEPRWLFLPLLPPPQLQPETGESDGGAEPAMVGDFTQSNGAGHKQTGTQTREQRQKGNKAITAVVFLDMLTPGVPKAQHPSYSNMGEDQVGDLR